MRFFYILERIKRLAYKLNLSENWRIYNVFIIAQLKSCSNPIIDSFNRSRSINSRLINAKRDDFVMDLIFALRMPSPVWINIASEKSFQSIRSLSTQSSSQFHTRFIRFLTYDSNASVLILRISLYMRLS